MAPDVETSRRPAGAPAVDGEVFSAGFMTAPKLRRDTPRAIRNVISATVNLILFEPAETATPLPRHDPRATHILEVLRRRVGETFDAGLVNGPLGKGKLAAIEANALVLTFCWNPAPPPPLDPITLVIGLPRPQTARDILRDATALGVATLHFVATEKGETSYAQSTLWSSGEWRRHLLAGAQQAFDTRLPALTHGRALLETLATLPASGTRLALDNYEAARPLSATVITAPVVLAIGGERGWSAREREQLRAHGFTLAHLGPRVLRTETAGFAALALVRARLGLM
jgi:16S rRNA (uracil1498-N3)-methyltransferase